VHVDILSTVSIERGYILLSQIINRTPALLLLEKERPEFRTCSKFQYSVHFLAESIGLRELIV
jgi:hypothetical protein